MLASALTIVALPAVWLANRDDPGARPNVAAVGLPAEADAAVTPEPVVVDPMGDVTARYLEGGSTAPAPDHVAVVVGDGSDVLVAAAPATYRRTGLGPDVCPYSGVDDGTLITVVNLDNDRSVQCRTKLRPMDQPQDELLLHPDRFAEIADLTSAPITVEIRR